MYNLRYHLASLVAVFLALSVGLLLGTIVVERGMLDRQREAIVRSLQEEFESLGAENDELRAALTLSEGLADSLLPAAIEGVLAERTVLVVANTGRTDGLADVTAAIEQAGGTPVAILIAEPALGLDDPAIAAAVTGLIGPSDPDDLVSRTTSALFAEWGSPVQARPLTDVLTEAGVLRVDEAFGLERGADAAVTLAQFAAGPDEAGLTLMSAFAQAGRPACGAQTQASEAGVALAAVEAGLSAVDHVGTPAGTFSLVWVLSGQATGHFGKHETADALWPE